MAAFFHVGQYLLIPGSSFSHRSSSCHRVLTPGLQVVIPSSLVLLSPRGVVASNVVNLSFLFLTCSGAFINISPCWEFSLLNSLAQFSWLNSQRYRYKRYILFYISIILIQWGGFPGGTSACQCRRYQRCGFDLWVRKTPWRRKWQRAPVFLPGRFRGQRSLVSYIAHGASESRNMAERLTATTTTNPMRSLKKWELKACVQSAILNWKIYTFKVFDTYN